MMLPDELMHAQEMQSSASRLNTELETELEILFPHPRKQRKVTNEIEWITATATSSSASFAEMSDGVQILPLRLQSDYAS